MRKPIFLKTDIIDKVKCNDMAAFAQLYELFKGRVYAVCLRKTKDVFDAEDLTQEVFLRVFLKVCGFRGEAAFGTWLHRVTINVIMMHFRRRRIAVLPLDEVSTKRHEATIGLQRGDHAHLGPVMRIALTRAIGSLPQGKRTALILHDVKGLTHREVAQRLGISSNTSKSQVHIAHRQLRDTLAGGTSR